MKLSKYFTLDPLIESNFARANNIENVPGKEEIENLKDLCTYVLDPVYEHFGHHLVITSGYRCPELNKAIRGAKNSQHIKGQAVDFQIMEVPHTEVCKVIEAAMEFDQLILEPTWVHVSFDRNHNRKQVLTKTPNGFKVGLP